jgi:hypothetical protein
MTRNHDGMTKRILATALWLLAGWYGGNVLAEVLGVSALLGPLLGVSVAFLVGADPRHLIWTRRAETGHVATLPREAAEPV